MTQSNYKVILKLGKGKGLARVIVLTNPEGLVLLWEGACLAQPVGGIVGRT